jgi:hypothetical protein
MPKYRTWKASAKRMPEVIPSGMLCLCFGVALKKIWSNTAQARSAKKTKSISEPAEFAVSKIYGLQPKITAAIIPPVVMVHFLVRKKTIVVEPANESSEMSHAERMDEIPASMNSTITSG